jgi:SnoaL-like domain
VLGPYPAVAATPEALIGRRDYDGARRLFSDEVLGFGTFADVACGLDELEADQWRQMWPNIEDFRFDLDSITTVESRDRLLTSVAVMWRSYDAGARGARCHRAGRATVVLVRRTTDSPWQARHTHFSLNRGVLRAS